MNLTNIHSIYFVGIGGIGMSALARYFNTLGKQVMGYDKTPTALTKQLEGEGISISYTDSIEALKAFGADKDHSLVVYTPAIPETNSILKGFQQGGFKLLKRAELLGMVTRETTCLAVAGTHGKTTASAILGHLLASCNFPVTAFLGGIAENYNSNLIQKGNEITVVEADEYDRSFLQLSPNIAGITSMDADHLDVYEKEEFIQDAFTEFANLLPQKGNLLIKKGLPLEGLTVGIEDGSDFEAQEVHIVKGSYVFNLKTPEKTYYNIQFSLPGRHNLFNALMALGMAIKLDAPIECLTKALCDFKGVKRRFSYKIKTENLVLIDDYAHHPTEINAVYQAVKEMYPKQNILAVFQPHLFSRTRDFAEDFAKSLSQFDELLLLDIYPAREQPLKGISSAWLLDKIEMTHKALVSKDQLLHKIKASNASVILLLGAGDIGQEVDGITQALSREN